VCVCARARARARAGVVCVLFQLTVLKNTIDGII